jgi:hypothetical protein
MSMTRVIKVNLECAADLEAEREFQAELDRDLPKPVASPDMWEELSKEIYEQRQKTEEYNRRKLEDPIIALVIPNKVDQTRELRRMAAPTIARIVPNEVRERDRIPVTRAATIPAVNVSDPPRRRRPKIGENIVNTPDST